MVESSAPDARRAALRSAAFLVVGPGTVTVVVPWALTRWRMDPVPGGWATRALGGALIAAGGGALAAAFGRFVISGLGTPIPADPPRNLVVTGLYRHVRNPMYVALEAVLIGETLLLGRPRLLVWAAVLAGGSQAYVRLREEPVLARRFGADYDRYRSAVPRWWPRLHPWDGIETSS